MRRDGKCVSWKDEDDGQGNTSSGFSGGNRSYGSFGGRSGSGSYMDETDYNDGAPAQSRAGLAIERGEQDKSEDYFDCIYVAFWDGNIWAPGHQPCPIIDSVMTDNDFNAIRTSYSLRLDRPNEAIDRGMLRHIDGKKKYNFSFLADEIPDVRAVFHIKGGRYLCEKITATFTE